MKPRYYGAHKSDKILNLASRLVHVINMKLGAALQNLKILQSKLARLYRLRADTFNVLESKSVEVDYDQLTAEITALVDEVRELKTRIVKTNANSMVTVEGKEMSIQELILLIADLRSDLSKLEELKPRGAVYLGGQAVEYNPQKKQDEMAQIISIKEQQKAELDKILQAKNWEAELFEN